MHLPGNKVIFFAQIDAIYIKKYFEPKNMNLKQAYCDIFDKYNIVSASLNFFYLFASHIFKKVVFLLSYDELQHDDLYIGIALFEF